MKYKIKISQYDMFEDEEYHKNLDSLLDSLDTLSFISTAVITGIWEDGKRLSDKKVVDLVSMATKVNTPCMGEYLRRKGAV